jgi:ubiquinone/menaquinone biosynthesis C-methylase UbiE
MDVFDLKYENESFDFVLDKGTLDAVFPENTPKIKENIDKLFTGVFRVLKKEGSYVFISLL